MTPLPLLLWDIDDVLNRLTALWLSTTARRLGTVLPEYAGLTENPPHKLLGVSHEAYLETLDECRMNYLYSEPPKAETFAFFQEHGHRFRALTLSGAPIAIEPLSAEWVLRHFGRWIQGTLFIPAHRAATPVLSQSFPDKAAAVVALGGTLIDDSPRMVEETCAAGGRALLFPAPWNRDARRPLSDFFNQLAKELC